MLRGQAFVIINQSIMQSIDINLIIEKVFCLKVGKNNIMLIFHALLFNIRNYIIIIKVYNN